MQGRALWKDTWKPLCYLSTRCDHQIRFHCCKKVGGQYARCSQSRLWLVDVR